MVVSKNKRNQTDCDWQQYNCTPTQLKAAFINALQFTVERIAF